MRITVRTALASTAAALALACGVSLGAAPHALAATKPMHITASGGDGTAVDSDGTQGSFTNSVQGKIDSDGDQDAFDAINSEEASPQEKAPNKMSK